MVSVLRAQGVANLRTLEQKIADAGPNPQRVQPHILTPVKNALNYGDSLPIPPSTPTDSAWCPRSDSNRHTLRYRILSPARLPIPPQGLQGVAIR